MLNKIKSSYFLEFLFKYHLIEKTNLEIIRYNKKIQKRLNISLQNYKDYYKIIIILIPIIKNKLTKEKNIFINIKAEERTYFHIYFNDKDEEIERNYFLKNEGIRQIKIKIDEKIKSLENLFSDCDCLEKIDFIKFNRDDITNLRKMFYNCEALNDLNVSKIKTDNVVNMEEIFYECSSLKKLNINNFITSNVINMKSMFFGCSLLNELNLTNFDTKKVNNMYCMFYNCSSLKELNLENFDTSNVYCMYCMFYGCRLLINLNISNFNVNKVDDMLWMFSGCSNNFKNKIKKENNLLREESFWDY